MSLLSFLESKKVLYVRKFVYTMLALIDRTFGMENGVVILCYHGISSDEFRFNISESMFISQMNRLIDDGYCFITAHQLVQWLQSGKKDWNGKACLINFDDGYRNILSVKKFLASKKIFPVVFVLSDIKNADYDELANKQEFLSDSEIIDLRNNGWSIGCHSATHRDFSVISSDAAKDEITASKNNLEKRLGFDIELFAYPKGSYSESIMDIVKKSGYVAAFSMDDGILGYKKNELSALPRVGIDKSHGLDEFLCTFSVSAIRMRRVAKKIFNFFDTVMNMMQSISVIRVLRSIRSMIMRFAKSKKRYFLFTAPKRSLKPISNKYGFDRGNPIDRYYIEKFMDSYRAHVQGRCLEITDNAYTMRFGGKRVQVSDVLDIDTKNSQANIHADLRRVNQVRDNTYDCIIATHTFGVIDEYQMAIQECFRMLKPGGVLLATVSALGVSAELEKSYWRFTRTSSKYAFGKVFGDQNVEVISYGNVLSGQAFWVGLAQEELSKRELEYSDPRYAVVIGICARKPLF